MFGAIVLIKTLNQATNKIPTYVMPLHMKFALHCERPSIWFEKPYDISLDVLF